MKQTITYQVQGKNRMSGRRWFLASTWRLLHGAMDDLRQLELGTSQNPWKKWRPDSKFRIVKVTTTIREEVVK